MKKSKTNKAWKRAAAGALSVALVAGTLPANVGGFLTGGHGIVMSAAAEDVVSEVTTVDSAETLAAAVQNGGYVKLSDNIALTATLNITKDVTIDLNGYNITATDCRAIWVKKGNLNLIGKGEISATSTGNKPNDFQEGSSVIRVGNGSTQATSKKENAENVSLTIGKDVTVSTAFCYGVTALGDESYATINVYGKINVSGNVSALSGNGYVGNSGTTINIYSGAEVTAANDVAIYHPQAGDLNITGGTIRGLGGIEAKAGTVNVLGSPVITATGEVDHSANFNGTSTLGYAIATVNNSGYAGPAAFNISGGTIIGSVAVLDDTTSQTSIGTISVTGGTFSTDVSGFVKSGYSAETVENKTVVKGAVSIGDTKYSTLQDALTAADTDETITLNADITLSSQVNLETGKKITLNLNGKNISAIDSRAIWVKNGDLSITGTGTISSYKTEGSDFANTSSVIRVCDGDAVENGSAKLTVGENVTVYSDICYGITVFGKVPGTLDVNGKVEVTGTASAISGNGSKGLSPTTININTGATVTATQDVAIYHPQAGTMNIKGGTITGKGAIEGKAGTINISGSPVITATGDIDHTTNNDGTSTHGYAIAAVNNKGYAGPVAFNISGGTITGSVAALNDANASGEPGTISVTGGKFVDANKAKQDVSGYFTADYAQDDYGYVREISAICWDEINDTTGKTYYNVSPTHLTVYDGETVKLRKPVTTTQIYIQNGHKGSIDLNGYNLTLDGYGFVGYNSTEDDFADLTIKNSGAAATLNGIKTNSQAFNIADYSKLTVGKGVTLTSAAAWTVVPHAYTTLDVYGTITNTYNLDGDSGYAISGNHDWSMGTVINIYKDAEVSAPYGNAIYQPHDGTLNITGGTVSGKTAIYARTGNINISGGNITAFGEKASAGTVANGADPTGDALAIQSHASYGVPVVRISGGNFSSENGKTVASYTVNNTAIPDISITGGTFSDILNTTFIANEYVQNEDKEVVKPKLEDISKYVTLTLNKTSFSYNNDEFEPEPIITVADGSNLVEGRDYEIEGDLSATEVGTYVVKVKGKNGYKGEVTATWSITESYAVDVYYGTDDAADYESLHRSFGQAVTVTANNVDGKVFSHWATSTDEETAQILSYSQTYSFIVKGNVVLHAIYADEEVEQQVVLNLTTFKSTYGGNHAVGFDFTRSVPEGYTVKEVGLLYGTNKLVGANTGVYGYAQKNLKTDGSSVGVSDLESALKSRSTVKKYVASSKTNNGTVRFSYALGNSNDGAYANAIGYVTYVDKNNKTVTVYSDVMAASYNTAG